MLDLIEIQNDKFKLDSNLSFFICQNLTKNLVFWFKLSDSGLTNELLSRTSECVTIETDRRIELTYLTDVVKVLKDGLVDFHEDDLLVNTRWKAACFTFLFTGFYYDDRFWSFDLVRRRHVSAECEFFTTIFCNAKELCTCEKVFHGWTKQ